MALLLRFGTAMDAYLMEILKGVFSLEGKYFPSQMYGLMSGLMNCPFSSICVVSFNTHNFTEEL